MTDWFDWARGKDAKEKPETAGETKGFGARDAVGIAISPGGYIAGKAAAHGVRYLEGLYERVTKGQGSPPPPEPERDIVTGNSGSNTAGSPRIEPRTPDITCSKIAIDGLDFPDWFDREFFKKPNGGRFPNSLVTKTRGKRVIDCKANFHKVWDQVEQITGKKAITLNEFVAHLMIMYNETGGTLVPSTEDGDDAYFFEYRIIEKKKGVPGSGRRKATYNGTTGNRLAGAQLLAWGKISESDVDTWNNGDRTVPQDPDADPRLPQIRVFGKYPRSQPEDVRMAARSCDFYKYRGRGLLQLTHFPTYQKCLDQVLKKEYDKVCDEMTNEALDEAFQNPAVYTAAFRNFITVFKKSALNAIPGVINGRFAAYGDAIAGGGGYGVNTFEPRCRAVRDLMKATGYSVG